MFTRLYSYGFLCVILCLHATHNYAFIFLYLYTCKYIIATSYLQIERPLPHCLFDKCKLILQIPCFHNVKRMVVNANKH